MKTLELNLEDPERLSAVTRALGSDIRIRILQLLDECSMNIVELAQKMDVPVSTVSNNVVILEEADLIRTRRQNGIRGVMKLCSRRTDLINIQLATPEARRVQSFFQQMPIGHYTDCQIKPVCGLASKSGIIGDTQDDVSVFYDPERFATQLLWFQQGYVEYRFSCQPLQHSLLKCMEFSFEACSEAPNYRKDWPSDITVWVNGVELGTWLCPGDFGGRQGRNTPEWWSMTATQYGLLKRWRVDEQGCTLDDEPLSGVTLKQLHLDDAPYISLRVGIKPDAAHQGGINLFGETFGDHNQAIILRLDCMEHHKTEGGKQA